MQDQSRVPADEVRRVDAQGEVTFPDEEDQGAASDDDGEGLDEETFPTVRLRFAVAAADDDSPAPDAAAAASVPIVVAVAVPDASSDVATASLATAAPSAAARSVGMPAPMLALRAATPTSAGVVSFAATSGATTA